MDKEIINLRNTFCDETGNTFTEDNENPRWEYVNWLEEKILNQ